MRSPLAVGSFSPAALSSGHHRDSSLPRCRLRRKLDGAWSGSWCWRRRVHTLGHGYQPVTGRSPSSRP